MTAWSCISRFQDADESPGFLLWRTSLLWKRKIEAALAPHGLTHAQFVLLAGVGYLTRCGQAASQSEAAKLTSCDAAMTSQVLRTLEKKDLVERSRKDGDERAKYPRLTDQVIEKLKQSIRDVEAADDEFFSALNLEQAAFQNHLQTLLTGSRIEFAPLEPEHFPLLLEWLERPHVKAWWDPHEQWTAAKIEEKYGPYAQERKVVDGVKKPIRAFIMQLDSRPIGYIQYYNAYDFRRDGDSVFKRLPASLAALDLYIGEKDCVSKGIGSLLIEEFLKRHVRQDFKACLVDVEAANTQAVRAYKKAGFKALRRVQDGKVVWMMREGF